MIIAIDPGINTTGIAVVEKINGTFHIYETHFLNNTRAFSKALKSVEKRQDSRFVRTIRIIEKIEEYVDIYNPQVIVTEAAFFNPRRPAAYTTLLEVIMGIKYGIIKDLKRPFREIPPKLVKRLFAKNGNAGKEVMEDKLKEYIRDKIVVLDKSIDLKDLTEHEIDAIAVGCSFYEEFGDLIC